MDSEIESNFHIITSNYPFLGSCKFATDRVRIVLEEDHTILFQKLGQNALLLLNTPEGFIVVGHDPWDGDMRPHGKEVTAV